MTPEMFESPPCWTTVDADDLWATVDMIASGGEAVSEANTFVNATRGGVVTTYTKPKSISSNYVYWS